MATKLLVIVDMQNDFIDGSLANDDAKAIVPGICDYIHNFEGSIVCTFDTHSLNYLKSTEGQYLPVEHCIKGTPGWNLNADIMQAIRERNLPTGFIEKTTFGYLDWGNLGLDTEVGVDEIYMVGTCTDICVISNALILKAAYPDVKIKVISSLCAGLTKEKHEAALEVMKSCQVEVVE